MNILTTAVYNVYFHPLRTYPGPKLWAAFRFPYVYYQLRARLPWHMIALHDQYGPIVRVAPDELAYTSSSAWNDIYGIRPNKPQNAKDLLLYAPYRKGQAPEIVRSNDTDHARYRRLISHAFSPKALDSQQVTVASYVDLLIQRLRENAAEPQDLAKWFIWLIFDIMGDLTFGESFDGLQDQRWHPWVDLMSDVLRTSVAVNAIRRYGLLPVFMSLVSKRKLEQYNQIPAYVKEQITARLSRETNRPDLIHYVMRNDKDGNQMSRAELESHAGTLSVAGTEGTILLLLATIYHLCMNPRTMEKLNQEVRTAFEDDREMNLNSLANLEYLNATIQEALRGILHPCPKKFPQGR